MIQANTVKWDVVVVGAGIGGISAAVSAARSGARTLLLDREEGPGGTGVFSPVTLICTFADNSGRIINDGLHREFFPWIYEGHPHALYTYDEQELLRRYEECVAAESLLEFRGEATVTEVERAGDRIARIRVERKGAVERLRAAVWVDATADGNLAAMADVPFQKGRSSDGAMQPATLTFRVTGVDFSVFPYLTPGKGITHWKELEKVNAELTTLFLDAKARGEVSIPKQSVLMLPYPNLPGTVAFNQTRISGVDPTDAASLRAGYKTGVRQIEEFFQVLQKHPAFASSRIEKISPRLGIREGRRVDGEYCLTADDCLGEARFPDMVAASGYALDIHDPDGQGTRLERIPGSGYYHIPYRCLIPLQCSNLLLGSRCISGTHEAHSSYRVMAPICSIGMAAGVAAALAASEAGGEVRLVLAEKIRARLRTMGQFVEGTSSNMAASVLPITIGPAFLKMTVLLQSPSPACSSHPLTLKSQI